MLYTGELYILTTVTLIILQTDVLDNVIRLHGLIHAEAAYTKTLTFSVEAIISTVLLLLLLLLLAY